MSTISSYFQLFAYFKNVSLLSCFLGLGIGYARGARRPLATPLVIPALALQVVVLEVVRRSAVAELLQNPIADNLTLGIKSVSAALHVVGVMAFLVGVFAVNALCFVPFGQLASRLMDRRGALVAYGWNLTGGSVDSHFPSEADMITFVSSGSSYGKKYGMQTMNDALYQLYMGREVNVEDCLRASHDQAELMRMLGMEISQGGEVKKPGNAPTAGRK